MLEPLLPIIQNLVSSCIYDLITKNNEEKILNEQLENEIASLINKDENEFISNIALNYKEYYILALECYSKKRYTLSLDLIKKAIDSAEYGLGKKTIKFKKNKLYLLGINLSIINDDLKLAQLYTSKIKFKELKKFAIQHYELALLTFLLKEYQSSFIHIKYALKYDKEQYLYKNHLSLLYLYTNKTDEALITQNESLKNASTQYNDIHDIKFLSIFNNLILIHMELQNFTKALEYSYNCELILEKKFHPVYLKKNWNTNYLISCLYTELVEKYAENKYITKLNSINEKLVRLKNIDTILVEPLGPKINNRVQVTVSFKKENSETFCTNKIYALKNEILIMFVAIYNNTFEEIPQIDIPLFFYQDVELLEENIELKYRLIHEKEMCFSSSPKPINPQLTIKNDYISIKNISKRCYCLPFTLKFKVITNDVKKYQFADKKYFSNKVDVKFNKIKKQLDNTTKFEFGLSVGGKINQHINNLSNYSITWFTSRSGNYIIQINNTTIKEFYTINSNYTQLKYPKNIVTDNMLLNDYEVDGKILLSTFIELDTLSKNNTSIKIGTNTLLLIFTDLDGNIKSFNTDFYIWDHPINRLTSLSIFVNELDNNEFNLTITWNINPEEQNLNTISFFLLPSNVLFKKEISDDFMLIGTTFTPMSNKYTKNNIVLDSQDNKITRNVSYILYAYSSYEVEGSITESKSFTF